MFKDLLILMRLVLIAAGGLVVETAGGGSYIAVDNTGEPYKWQGPIEMRFDKGPLGRLSKEEADALVLEAMSAWMDPRLPGSNVQFVRGPDLEVDHGDGSGNNPNWETGPPHDGISPVIYDQNGLLLDTIGENASLSVVGATDIVYPADGTPAPLTEALLIMNGRMLPPPGGFSLIDLPIDTYRGTIIHELGHVLNLGHSQAAVAFTSTGYDVGNPFGNIFGTERHPGDYRGMPTMFPTVLPQLETLEMDDMAWVYDMYGNNTSAVFGSISGFVRDAAGDPFNGANVVAYSVDDPTSMVTAVSGYTDADPYGAPTGFYRIPGLPVGSKWIVDVEPIVDAFTGGSRLGPIDPPPALPGMPEFANEPGIESDSDVASLSTTFVIEDSPEGLHYTDINVQFNSPEIFDVVEEDESGFDEFTGQIIPVTPGRMMLINGVLEPNDPDMQELGFLGAYGDFFRVDNPAGLELNQMAIFYEGSLLDVLVLDLKEDNVSEQITSTGSDMGMSAVSLYLDSSRVGDEAHRGIFSFAVGYTFPFFSGSNPRVVTPYTLMLAFSVSDRDALALGGTDSGEIDPDAGVVRVRGRGFKNVGGPPVVTFDGAGIEVTNVTFVDENNLDVELVKTSGYVPGPVTMQVTNHEESGGYGGRIRQTAVGEASAVIGWELY